MGILSVVPGQTGLVGVLPSIAYIQTNDPVATVTATGYLNKAVSEGTQFSLPCIAVVSTKETPTSVPQVGWYEVQHVGVNWSLDAGSNTGLALANGLIFVGNASNLAAPVAMSGDVTISNAGVTTIANNAITTAKILAANVTLAKLAAGITPAYIIKLGGKDVSAGGSATVTITATGVVATDLAFAAIQASANAVSIQKVTAGTDQIVVLCSADPGAATICWAAERAAA
jgi:hypothetical protein